MWCLKLSLFCFIILVICLSMVSSDGIDCGTSSQGSKNPLDSYVQCLNQKLIRYGKRASLGLPYRRRLKEEVTMPRAFDLLFGRQLYDLPKDEDE